MVRKLSGLAVGVAIALVLLMSIEAIGNRVFPISADQMDGAPLGFRPLLPVVIGWFVGTFVGGFVAVLIARQPWVAWAVAGAIILGEAIAFILASYPLWAMAAGFVLPLFGAWAAYHLACQRVTL